jgi:uncharacterized membrane protein YcaP (DUF421 family)
VLLVALNAIVVRAVARNERAVRLFEGSPTVLVHDGRLDPGVLRRLGIRKADVEDALHRSGADSVDQVAEAVLEPGGTIVVRQHTADQAATKGDLAALERRLLTAIGADRSGDA